MTVKNETTSSRIAESKFLRVFMILVGAFLLFVGPTYIPYLMAHLLDIDLAISSLTGLVLFLVGVVFLVFLARKKVIT